MFHTLEDARLDQINNVLARSSDDLPVDSNETSVRVVHQANPQPEPERPRDVIVESPGRPAQLATVDTGQDPTLRVTLHASRDKAEVVEQPVEASTSPATPADRAYDTALELLNAGAYDKAIVALGDFVMQHPNDARTISAMYWRAQAYASQHDCAHAVAELEGVLRRGARDKEPDTLYALGACHQKLGNAERAKTYFDALARKFPRSDAAKRLSGS